ncbi:M24 family metallopeptidase [Babesia caballi]|uniref:M24 family metallopeptidase n=1 Tax=Babesia caballi TaxID=5871 RepID=A0AAV4M2H9_BABCB|nr:M24 family metallopeptidase [Babesia caballi]
MAAAKAINAVGEEGLEGGVGCFATGRIFVFGRMKAMFTTLVGATSGAIMPATRLPAAGQPRAHMGGHCPTGAIRLHFLPKDTVLPTTLVHIVRAHGIQKEKLELEGISVAGNCTEKGGAGGVLELESGVAEKLKQPWIGSILGRTGSLDQAQYRGREGTRRTEIVLQLVGG